MRGCSANTLPNTKTKPFTFSSRCISWTKTPDASPDSSSFEAWQNAVANASSDYSGWLQDAVIAEENDGMLYDVIFDFND